MSKKIFLTVNWSILHKSLYKWTLLWINLSTHQPIKELNPGSVTSKNCVNGHGGKTRSCVRARNVESHSMGSFHCDMKRIQSAQKRCDYTQKQYLVKLGWGVHMPAEGKRTTFLHVFGFKGRTDCRISCTKFLVLTLNGSLINWSVLFVL